MAKQKQDAETRRNLEFEYAGWQAARQGRPRTARRSAGQRSDVHPVRQGTPTRTRSRSKTRNTSTSRQAPGKEEPRRFCFAAGRAAHSPLAGGGKA